MHDLRRANAAQDQALQALSLGTCRARDDTISELMPLPRRMDNLRVAALPEPGRVFADRRRFSAACEVEQRVAVARGRQRRARRGVPVPASHYRPRDGGGLGRRARVHRNAPDTRRSSGRSAAAPACANRGATEARISPTSLVQAARESVPIVDVRDVNETAVPPEPDPVATPKPRRIVTERSRPPVATPVPPPTDPDRGLRAGSREKLKTLDAVQMVPVPVQPKLDRWQSLSAALSRCTGADPWKRSACEQGARNQYCDGAWDQTECARPALPTTTASNVVGPALSLSLVCDTRAARQREFVIRDARLRLYLKAFRRGIRGGDQAGEASLHLSDFQGLCMNSLSCARLSSSLDRFRALPECHRGRRRHERANVERFPCERHSARALIAMIGGCNDCHTPNYAPSGGKVPEAEWLKGDGVSAFADLGVRPTRRTCGSSLLP